QRLQRDIVGKTNALSLGVVFQEGIQLAIQMVQVEPHLLEQIFFVLLEHDGAWYGSEKHRHQAADHLGRVEHRVHNVAQALVCHSEQHERVDLHVVKPEVSLLADLDRLFEKTGVRVAPVPRLRDISGHGLERQVHAVKSAVAHQLYELK